MSSSRGGNIRQQVTEKQIWTKEKIRNKRKQKDVTSEVSRYAGLNYRNICLGDKINADEMVMAHGAHGMDAKSN